MNTTTFDTALYWRSLGVSTIPVEPSGKRPATSWKRWQTEIPTVSQLAEWFYDTKHNIAVITGGESGLVVLDFDTSATFAQWATGNRSVADRTRIESTPNGHHAYLFVVEPVQSQLVGEIEVKSGGQCCNVAPSVYEGKEYRVIQDRPPLTVQAIEDALPTATTTELSKRETPNPHRDQSFPFPERRLARASVPSDGLVTRIKQSVPVLSLLARYTEPQPTSPDGRWWVMRCPNPEHHDEHPSFWADAVRGLCGCRVPWCKNTQPGRRSMDVINLYAWLHGCDNQEAIEALADEL